jgi:hypothetical protein
LAACRGLILNPIADRPHAVDRRPRNHACARLLILGADSDYRQITGWFDKNHRALASSKHPVVFYTMTGNHDNALIFLVAAGGFEPPTKGL